MIDFINIAKNYGGQTVFTEVNFRINAGERIGIVGPNGAGKTTLFALLTGELTPDAGKLVMPADLEIGYVRQHTIASTGDESLLDRTQNAVPTLRDILPEIHAIEEELHRAGDAAPPATLRRLGELQTEFEHRGGYAVRHLAEQALCGLGFSVESLQQPFRTLSGGWQTRAELARVLVAQPKLLMLDEPSNYLDLPAVEWLRAFLQDYKGTLLLVSHDRFLLNTLTRATIEVANRKVERYAGNYDNYVKERSLRYEQRAAAFKNQDRKRQEIERFIERFRAKNTKSTQVQSRIKMLEKMEVVEVPHHVIRSVGIRLRPPPHSGIEVMRLENIGMSYDGARWVLRGVELRIARGERIALVGYNGMGKTTLQRILAGRLAPSEGRRVVGHKVEIGYQAQDFAETMDPESTLYETVHRVAADAGNQEIRTLLGGFGFSGEAVDKRVAVLSGGEKVRLAFARLLIKPPNFLILDEPTTHLDIQAREMLENALREFTGTVCFVSHDLDFVRRVGTHVVAMTPPGVTRYPGDYDYYRDKMAQLEAAREPQAAREAETRAASAADGAATPSKKALRQERAQQRQAAYERIKTLKKEVQQAEKQIAVYEQERDKILAQFAAQTEGLDFAALNKRLKHIQDDIERYTKRWEIAAQELEVSAKAD